MANSNPKTDNLVLGRGKRPKLGHETVSMRLSPATRQLLEEVAQSYGCLYGDKPWIAGLLEKIGRRELIVVPAPPQPIQNAQQEWSIPQQAELDRVEQKYEPWLNENSPNDTEKT